MKAQLLNHVPRAAFSANWSSLVLPCPAATQEFQPRVASGEGGTQIPALHRTGPVHTAEYRRCPQVENPDTAPIKAAPPQSQNGPAGPIYACPAQRFAPAPDFFPVGPGLSIDQVQCCAIRQRIVLPLLMFGNDQPKCASARLRTAAAGLTDRRKEAIRGPAFAGPSDCASRLRPVP